MTEYRSEVFDLGYQHYKGPREGQMRARKAIWINGMRTALGLGRGRPRANVGWKDSGQGGARQVTPLPAVYGEKRKPSP